MSIDIFSWVSQYGVAIGIAVYLVYWVTTKLNSKLDTLVNAVNELSKNVQSLNTNIEKLLNHLSSSKRNGG
jgi:peptidoglycan hydrolase CwlO-like protein